MKALSLSVLLFALLGAPAQAASVKKGAFVYHLIPARVEGSEAEFTVSFQSFRPVYYAMMVSKLGLLPLNAALAFGALAGRFAWPDLLALNEAALAALAGVGAVARIADEFFRPQIFECGIRESQEVYEAGKVFHGVPVRFRSRAVLNEIVRGAPIYVPGDEENASMVMAHGAELFLRGRFVGGEFLVDGGDLILENGREVPLEQVGCRWFLARAAR